MLNVTMQFYCSKLKNGNIEVQNVAMGMLGQHHVHTPEDFKRWSKDIPKEAIIWLDIEN